MFDQPQQQFFAFDATFGRPLCSVSMLTEAGLGVCYEHQITDAMKVELFAQGRQQLTLRLENIDDSGATSTVDLEGIAYCLATQMDSLFNGSVEIKELSLNANMEYAEMIGRKLLWTGIGESKPQPLVVNTDYTAVEMGPQRIRVFSLNYQNKEEFLQ